MITLGERSLSRLEGVHPDLVRVVKRAAATASKEQDFSVLEGVRSEEQMCINYGKGRTAVECLAKGVPSRYAAPSEKKVTWLAHPFASKHGIAADGFGHAVDLVPFPIDWNNLDRFKEIVELMMAGARQEEVNIVAGANWVSNKDYPHFELVS